MLQIEPQKSFPIVRNLNNPRDTGTYYVRAYIYDGVDADDLLDTVDLTDLGSQRFKKNWQTPVDSSGQGRYITIFTKVFTDSGYTTESTRYAREEEMFLIKEGWNRVYGEGGGADVSYKRIRKIVQEEIKKRKIEKVDLGFVIKALQETQKRISAIRIPELDFDIKPLLDLIETSNASIKKEIKGRIDDIRIPENDLTPLIRTLNQSAEELNKFKDSFESLKKVFMHGIELVQGNVDKINNKMKSVPIITIEKPEEKKPPKRKLHF